MKFGFSPLFFFAKKFACTIVYFNIRGGKDIEKIMFDDVKNTKNNIKGVQTQSLLAGQLGSF